MKPIEFPILTTLAVPGNWGEMHTSPGVRKLAKGTFCTTKLEDKDSTEEKVCRLRAATSVEWTPSTGRRSAGDVGDPCVVQRKLRQRE